MKVSELFNELESNKGKELLFSYNSIGYVKPNYHLTEVKNVQFDTTDCGGKTNHWKETQMQLWENPAEIGKRDYMTVDKIMAILERVDGINPLMKDTEVKFEYGNREFPTSVMAVRAVESLENSLLVHLGEEKALCKASGAGELKASEKVMEEKCCQGVSGC